MALLLDDLLFSPITLVAWIGEKLKETAEAELMDSGSIQNELLELQIRLELGEIGEKEYLKRETKLMKNLEFASRYEEAQNE